MASQVIHSSKLDVVFEDNHLLVINKAPGALVQGDITRDKPLVDYCKEYIAEKYNKPGKVYLATLHRIDRPVSGLVMFARTSKAAERMSRLFQQKKINKTYWAITAKRPPEESGILTHWLVKDPSKNTVKAYSEEVEEGKKATTHFKVLGQKNKHYLVQLNPVTGRPHQLRAQLGAIGCPIKGDIKYGFPKGNKDKSINLHAKMIKCSHPVKSEPVLLQAGLPNNPFWEQFLALDEINKDARSKNKFIDKLY